MSDDPPTCFHCTAVIPPGMGWRENGILFLAKEHADDWLVSVLAWLAGDDDERREMERTEGEPGD